MVGRHGAGRPIALEDALADPAHAQDPGIPADEELMFLELMLRARPRALRSPPRIPSQALEALCRAGGAR